MSVDKLVDSTQLDADLTSIANAIRTKGGTSSQLAFPNGFVSAVQDIPTGGGGGSFPNLMNFEEVLVASTATEISVQLTPSNDCAILFLIKDIGEPDATMYKSLYWTCLWFNGGGSSLGNGILRPNGTIGSDTGMASFTRTTGVFKFGNGSYGKAFAGDTYYIYQFSVVE